MGGASRITKGGGEEEVIGGSIDVKMCHTIDEKSTSRVEFGCIGSDKPGY